MDIGSIFYTSVQDTYFLQEIFGTKHEIFGNQNALTNIDAPIPMLQSKLEINKAWLAAYLDFLSESFCNMYYKKISRIW